MAKSQIILCDTNIVIGYLIGEEKITRQLDRITSNGQEWDRLAISVITYGEVYPASFPGDKMKTRRFLRNFAIVDLDRRASRLAKEYFNESYYHARMLMDCLIGATAVSNDMPVWTINRKDFRHFKGIQLHTPR